MPLSVLTVLSVCLYVYLSAYSSVLAKPQASYRLLKHTRPTRSYGRPQNVTLLYKNRHKTQLVVFVQ
jgi:hypothetical protein